MPVTTLPPLRSPQRDLHFMGQPSLWVAWPFLPLIRRHQDGRLDFGVLFDAQAVCHLTGYGSTVWLTNLFTIPRQAERFFALPREVFDTFDEVIAAGWRVD